MEVTNIESSDITIGLTDKFLIESIKEQAMLIFNSYPIDRDFLGIFKDRVKYIMDTYHDDPALLNNVKDIKREFYKEVLEIIKSKYKLEVSFEEDALYFIRIESLYKFFILDAHKNLVSYYIQSILTNKKSIITKYKNLKEKSSSLNTKKRKFNNDRNNGYILHYFTEIIKDFSNNDLGFYTILETIISGDPDRYDYIVINQMFNENFVASFEDNIFEQEFFKIINEQNSIYPSVMMEINTKLYDDLMG